MDILKKLAEEFKLNAWQVENTVKLIDEGNTIGTEKKPPVSLTMKYSAT